MRFSRARLALKYATRSSYFGAAMLLSLMGLMMTPWFLPSDPRVNRAGDPLWRTGEFVPFGIGLAAWAAGIGSLLVGIRDVRRKVRLIADGAPALGLIGQVEIVEGRKGRSFVRCLNYAFLTEKGGEMRLRRAELEWDVPYGPGEVTPGDVILVAHDPDDPTRHEIDRFDARRDDRLRLLDGARLAALQREARLW